jgi:predicted enzyme related to lactoylglutathione lyase
MPTRAVNLVIDARDPLGLARFWSAGLQWPITYEEDDEVVVEPPEDDPSQRGQLPLVFVLVEDEKATKNRVHVDLATEDREAEVERLVALGATRVDDQDELGLRWTVLRDPEGNEFCVAGP